jgi:hypothetical protein
MAKILAFSGRKQSGKTSAANFIFGMEMLSIDLVSYFKINDNGQLIVPSTQPEGVVDGVFDPHSVTAANIEWMIENVWPFAKTYSMAETLKNIVIEVLGIDRAKVYGSDDDKNSETHILWENMPIPGELIKETKGRIGKYKAKAEGPMTVREVLQYVGTDIFRKIHDNVWVDACIRKIEEDSKFFSEPQRFALIGDVRFPNEVEGVQKAGGKVIRLTRTPHPEDDHASETALDKENFDWDKFDAVIDNAEIDIHEKNSVIYETLKQWDWLPYEVIPGETVTK